MQSDYLILKLNEYKQQEMRRKAEQHRLIREARRNDAQQASSLSVFKKALMLIHAIKKL